MHRALPLLVVVIVIVIVSCRGLQGEADEELPEVMLGVVRVRKLDVLLADSLGADEDPEVSGSPALSGVV